MVRLVLGSDLTGGSQDTGAHDINELVPPCRSERHATAIHSHGPWGTEALDRREITGQTLRSVA